jgi:hypothetical protein
MYGCETVTVRRKLNLMDSENKALRKICGRNGKEETEGRWKLRIEELRSLYRSINIVRKLTETDGHETATKF